jgi:ankyrin repeat protein
MMAARGGHILTVKLLLDEGADATLKNEVGMTAIDFAKKHEHHDIAEGLTYRLKKAGKL